MAGDWLDNFTNILDSATGVLQATANVIKPPAPATTVPVPSPLVETAPKQKLAAVSNNEAPASTFPWAIVLGAVVILALVEW